VPSSIAITVIVLVARDRADLGPWHERLETILSEVALPYEIIYAVSDRAPLATVEIESRRRSGRVRTLLLSHWFDEAAAIERAAGLGQGELIAVLPAGGEVALEDLPCLLRELRACDIVLARRAGPLEGTFIAVLRRRSIAWPAACSASPSLIRPAGRAPSGATRWPPSATAACPTR
jgi:hypothetical protein